MRVHRLGWRPNDGVHEECNAMFLAAKNGATCSSHLCNNAAVRLLDCRHKAVTADERRQGTGGGKRMSMSTVQPFSKPPRHQ